MVTSQWLLAQLAHSGQKVYMYIEFGEKQLACWRMLPNNARNWSAPSATPSRT